MDSNAMLLRDILKALDEKGFLFRTQGIYGDEYVPAKEIAEDLKHGDMAEMLDWYAEWNPEALTVTTTAPAGAVESLSIPVVFHVRHTGMNTGNCSGGRKVEHCPTFQSRRAATGRVETTAPARRASSSVMTPMREPLAFCAARQRSRSAQSLPEWWLTVLLGVRLNSHEYRY